jgi:hypothetical protein
VITKIVVERPQIPENLLDCDIPQPGEYETNGQAQVYVAELHRQAMACSAKAGAVRAIVGR